MRLGLILIAVSLPLVAVAKPIPIEPVGVIVLGIDGLRQDVLYAPPGGTNDGTDVFSTYADPNGCGTNASCYVEPAKLTGLCDVLGGKGGFSCDTTGWGNKHIKLKDVTAIFPSVTLASWASIFSGKMPSETGIAGNEFFARDLGKHVPLKFNNPAGMISFDSGAFKGYDEFTLWNMLWANKDDKSYFFIPYQFDWESPVDTAGTPQNDPAIYTAPTVFESIKAMPEVSRYFTEKGGDPVVVSYSHYARGAYWLTWDMELGWGESQTLDKASWSKFNEYLNGKYLTSNVRNNTPFSAITVWYVPGLDHQAHLKGMEKYRDYFKDTTDDYILNLTTWLQSNDEFENKIFIVVADHGHTAMPTNLTYTKTEVLGIDDAGNKITQDVIADAEMSCKLKLDFQIDPLSPEEGKNKRNAELNNNNLHIWELGEILKTAGEESGLYYKVLAPAEIVTANKGESTTIDPKYASVITALNGPMAHIYVKGANNDWTADPQNDLLIKIADLLQATLVEGDGPFPRLASSVQAILIRFTQNSGYAVYNGATINAAGQITLNTPIPLATYFSDSQKYIDALNRVTRMNHPKRSGDIILIMKDATTGDVNDRFTTGVACKSWHGSLNPSDSYVPLIVSYPGGNKFELDPMIQKVCADNLCEGNWKAKDLISEIIKTQYFGQ